MKKISLIILTHNEMNNQFFKQTLKNAQSLCDIIEVIIMDYDSTDGTKEFIKNNNFIYHSSTSNSRAARLNEAAALATGQMIVFNHPRSVIELKGLKKLSQICDQKIWGGFTHCFDKNQLLLKFTSWYSNQVRAKIRGIIYLDHCIFCSSKLFNTIQFPNVDIFEDTIFTQELNKICAPHLLNYASTTSSIRFVKNGIYRQALLNQILKIGFLLKLDDRQMNKIYELGLNLNSKY